MNLIIHKTKHTCLAEKMILVAICLVYSFGICHAQTMTPEQAHVVSLFKQANQYNSEQNYPEAVKLYQESIRLAETAFGKQDPNYVSLITNLANVYQKSGSFINAEKLYQNALESWEKIVGPNHPKVASTLNLQAILYYSQGKFAQALPLMQRALAIRKKAFGTSHPDVAETLNNLAALYSSLGDYQNAEALYKEALKVCEQLYGKESINSATTLVNLGGVLRSLGKFEDGIVVCKKGLALKEKFYGPEHPSVATSLDTLGNLYFDMKKFDQTEATCKRSLQIREKVLGPNHPETATSMNNLSALYESRAMYSDAEPLLKQAVAIYKESLGSEHPTYASGLHNLGSLYSKIGRFSEAEELLLKAVALRKKIYGDVHNEVADTLNNLAGLYLDTGKYGKAKEIYEKVLETRKKVFGAEHPAVAATLNNVASIYSHLGDNKHALDLYRMALTMREKTLGKDHIDVAESCNNLASVYQSMGDSQGALSLYQKSLKIVEKTMADSVLAAKILMNIAELRGEMDAYATAFPLYRQGVALLENNLGYEHLDVATAYNNLAGWYLAAGEFNNAESFYQKALAIRNGKLPPDHPSFSLNLFNLSAVYAAQDKSKLALSYMKRGIDADRNLIDQAMGFSSERQKLSFLEKKQWHLYGLFTLVNKYFQDDVTAKRYLFDVWLQRKGIILEARKQFQESLIDSDNSEAVTIYQKFAQVSAELSRLTFANNGKIDRISYQKRVNELGIAKEELEVKLSQISQAFAGQKKISTADTQTIAALLPPDHVLVDFARIQPINFKARGIVEKWAPERYFAFILNSGKGESIDIIDLGDAQMIDNIVAELKREITRVQDIRKPSYSEPCQKLYSLVFDPIKKKLGDVRNIYISPDGNLNLVPFEVLQGPDGKFLIENYTFNYMAAGRDIVGFGGIKAKGGKALLMGDPDFDFGVEEKDVSLRELALRSVENTVRHTRSLDMRGYHFSRLPGTREEVSTIHKLLGDNNSEVYTGKEALEEVLKQKGTPTILHLATHGFFLDDSELQDFFDDKFDRGIAVQLGKISQKTRVERIKIENPLLRSGIALAGANNTLKGNNIEKSGGIVTAEKILGLRLRGTDMVVLSACDTGVGEVKAGEGVFGLRRAFIQAGAKSLVMSMWSVPDRETKELMIEFYKNIQPGKMNRCQALRQATLREMKIVKDRYGQENPLYWGAFLFLGEP